MNKLLGALLTIATTAAGAAIAPVPVSAATPVAAALSATSVARSKTVNVGMEAIIPRMTPGVVTGHHAGTTGYQCPSGYLCLAVFNESNFLYKIFYLYYCREYALHDWRWTGSYRNSQTGNVVTTLYDINHNVITTFTPDSLYHGVDWNPVWYVRSC